MTVTDPYVNPSAFPVGPGDTSGTTYTVDTLTRPISRYEEVLFGLVEEGEGYYINDVFNFPSWRVQGGGILYREAFPEDIFPDPAQSPAPRAPLAKAPIIGTKRRGRKIARVENLSGAIIVSDEAERDNDVLAVEQDMQRLANYFANTLQQWGMETLSDFMSTSNRQVVATHGWHKPVSSGVINVDPLTLPFASMAQVFEQFENDRVNLKPTGFIVSPLSAYYLRVIYQDKLKGILDDQGLTMRVSPQIDDDTARFYIAKQVGVVAFAEETNTKETILGEGQRGRMLDTQATPAFVANNAAAVLDLTGISSTS